MDTLEQRCFKQNIDPSLKELYRRSWATYYPIHVTHRISLPLVRLLLRTPVTPTHVTFSSLVIGIISGLLFFTASSKAALIMAAFFFELYYVLDAVDGQLARARNASSRGGGFLDDWGNFLVVPFIIFCIGLNFGPKLFFPWPAFLASYAILSIPLTEVVMGLWFTDRKKTVAQMLQQDDVKKRYPERRIYGLLYRSCTMPVVMNCVTIATFLMLAGVWSSLYFFVGYYALVGTLVWVAKVMKAAFSE